MGDAGDSAATRRGICRRPDFERVPLRAGAGLVYVNPTDPDDQLQAAFTPEAAESLLPQIAESLPLDALSLDRDLELPFGAKSPDYRPRHVGPLEIRAGKLGAGRVVFLDYHDQRNAGYPWRSVTGLTQSLTPDVEYDPLFYDYYHAILAKTVLWAARQDVAVAIRADQPTAGVAQFPPALRRYRRLSPPIS